VSPTWSPKMLDPSSRDDRQRGVMLGAIQVTR
jgi:hypothetical protein